MLFDGAIFDQGRSGGRGGDSSGSIPAFHEVAVVLSDEDMLNPSAILLRLVLMHERELQRRQELLRGLAPFLQWGSAGSAGDDAWVLTFASLLTDH